MYSGDIKSRVFLEELEGSSRIILQRTLDPSGFIPFEYQCYGLCSRYISISNFCNPSLVRMAGIK